MEVNKMKRFFATLLALTLMFGALVSMPIKAHAAGTSLETSLETSRTAIAVGEDGRFRMRTEVSVDDGAKLHDEVIVMIDGSYSTNDDWYGVRTSIMKLGEKVLEDEKNSVLLTVMTFGTGDNIVLEHAETVEQLSENLPQEPGKLLYGRASTNCEAGFTGILKYIKNHDETLNKAHVVYITDGEVNTDESEYVFSNWTNNPWLKKDALTLAKWSIGEELEAYNSGETKLSNAYLTAFDDSKTDISEDEKSMKWANQVWKDVYEYSGMNLESPYAISDTERAFVKYDEENGTHVREIFYYTIWGREYADKEKRTTDAGIALAKSNKVAHLHMVAINSATPWMTDINSATSNVSLHEAGSVSNLLTTLSGISINLDCPVYSEITVTDYMSKWVNLNTDTIKVIDENTATTIWSSRQGWVITGKRPTSHETPIVVEMIPNNKYEEGGPDVVGNENDVIYRITWYVKDGEMLRNHEYSLMYEVNVDIHENGFKYNTKYPSNGYSTVEYIKENGDKVTHFTREIATADVSVSKAEEETKPETKPTTAVKEMVDVKGKATWNDKNNKYQKRPEVITVNLIADGKKIASKKVTAEEKWKYSFEGLPKYNDKGKQIVYTVRENKIANYKTEIDGYDIVNTYEKSTIDSSKNNDGSPRTGDYIMVVVASTIILGVILFILLRMMRKK